MQYPHGHCIKGNIQFGHEARESEGKMLAKAMGKEEPDRTSTVLVSLNDWWWWGFPKLLVLVLYQMTCAAVRVHLTPVRMAAMRKVNHKCWYRNLVWLLYQCSSFSRNEHRSCCMTQLYHSGLILKDLIPICQVHFCSVYNG